MPCNWDIPWHFYILLWQISPLFSKTNTIPPHHLDFHYLICYQGYFSSWFHYESKWCNIPYSFFHSFHLGTMLFIVTLMHCIFNIISLNLKHNKESGITCINSSSIQFLKGSGFFYIFNKQIAIKFTVHVKSWKKWQIWFCFNWRRTPHGVWLSEEHAASGTSEIFGVMYWLKGILPDVELKVLSKFSKIWTFCIFS